MAVLRAAGSTGHQGTDSAYSACLPRLDSEYAEASSLPEYGPDPGRRAMSAGLPVTDSMPLAARGLSASAGQPWQP